VREKEMEMETVMKMDKARGRGRDGGRERGREGGSERERERGKKQKGGGLDGMRGACSYNPKVMAGLQEAEYGTDFPARSNEASRTIEEPGPATQIKSLSAHKHLLYSGAFGDLCDQRTQLKHNACIF